jgi:hypothetical protein
MNATSVAFVLLVAAYLANVTQPIVTVVVRIKTRSVRVEYRAARKGRFFYTSITSRGMIGSAAILGSPPYK